MRLWWDYMLKAPQLPSSQFTNFYSHSCTWSLLVKIGEVHTCGGQQRQNVVVNKKVIIAPAADVLWADSSAWAKTILMNTLDISEWLQSCNQSCGKPSYTRQNSSYVQMPKTIKVPAVLTIKIIMMVWNLFWYSQIQIHFCLYNDISQWLMNSH